MQIRELVNPLIEASVSFNYLGIILNNNRNFLSIKSCGAFVLDNSIFVQCEDFHFEGHQIRV